MLPTDSQGVLQSYLSIYVDIDRCMAYLIGGRVTAD